MIDSQISVLFFSHFPSSSHSLNLAWMRKIGKGKIPRHCLPFYWSFSVSAFIFLIFVIRVTCSRILYFLISENYLEMKYFFQRESFNRFSLPKVHKLVQIWAQKSSINLWLMLKNFMSKKFRIHKIYTSIKIS